MEPRISLITLGVSDIEKVAHNPSFPHV